MAGDIQEFPALVLAPLAGDRPAGADLRDDQGPQSLYSRLRDLRSEARGDERAADNDEGGDSRAPAAWASVEALAIEALGERTKDLEIAAWLAEALVRRHGLSGLTVSARIIDGLVENFWGEGLYPSEDADDPEGRVFAITGLSGSDRDGSLMQPLRKVVLFNTVDGEPVALWQYQRAQTVATLNEQARKQQHEKAGVIPFPTLEAAARTVGQPTLIELGWRVREARAAWGAMESRFAEAAGANAPSTGRVTALLNELDHIVRRYVSEDTFRSEPETIAVEDEMVVPETVADENGSTPAARPLKPAERTREELLDDILTIAVQFRKSEPNSPLSYTLEDAVRRARLPLPDLLREIIPELSARVGVLTLLGIRPSDEPE